jgi:CDP-glycerol glycerophosphotransferase
MNPSVLAGTVVASATIDSVVLDDGLPASLTFSGPITEGTPSTVSLVGSRVVLRAAARVAKSRWSATVPLTASRWDGPERPAPSGRYRLTLESADGVTMSARVNAILPADQLVPDAFRIALSETDGALNAVLSAPLTDAERGPGQQARLEAEYRETEYPVERAVFFESFYGQSAACNPLAIDRAIAKLLPAVTRYWGVVDASVVVPAGARAVVEGSTEWWHARGASQIIVINDWMRKRYRKRRDQTVLQTWHGTMLKKIAINRTRFAPRATIAAMLESKRWDILLSQNAYSSRIFRSAYRYTGPIWEEGYPRDDSLSSDAATGAASDVRNHLGIAADTTVVLYAPTWRDDRPEQIDHLDVSEFTKALGPGYVTLIRGHSRSLVPGQDVKARNVIDVTGYPDVTDLFLAADVLVTDYSSVMFDFSVTAKPIFFYTPDLAHYRKQLRGFYFDLIDIAPGPVVESAAELVELIKRRDALQPEYSSKYQAWRERFNPRDDGHAAERVVARLVATGAIS